MSVVLTDVKHLLRSAPLINTPPQGVLAWNCVDFEEATLVLTV